MKPTGRRNRRAYAPPDWVFEGLAIEEAHSGGQAQPFDRQPVSIYEPSCPALARIVESQLLDDHWKTLAKTNRPAVLVAQIAALVRRSQDPRGITQKRVRKQLAKQICKAADEYVAAWNTILDTRDPLEAARDVLPTLHRTGVLSGPKRIEHHLSEVRDLADSALNWAAADKANTHSSKPNNRRTELVVQLTALMRSYLKTPSRRLVAEFANVVFDDLPGLSETHVIKLAT